MQQGYMDSKKPLLTSIILFFSLHWSLWRSRVVFLTSRLTDIVCHNGHRLTTRSAHLCLVYTGVRAQCVLLTLLLLREIKREEEKEN